MLVNEFLENSARIFGGKEALVFENQRLTYTEVDEKSNRLANALRSRGIRRHDRVIIYLANGVESILSIFAVLKTEGVFVVVNRSTKIDKLSAIINDCRAKGIITDQEAADEISPRRGVMPSLELLVVCGQAGDGQRSVDGLSLETILDSFEPDPPKNTCIDMDLASLIYTSGSTGHPKGVMLTHLNIVSAATSITQYLENRSSDIIINVLPLSFDYGLYQVLMAFKIGGTLILEKSFSYPFVVINRILEEKVTGFPIVPTIAAILVQMEGLGKYCFDHLRYITNTAAHLPGHHIATLRKLFPKTQIYCMYGLTECKRVSYLPPSQLDKRPDSVGRGMPNEEVFIVDEDGERVGSGKVGELVVRGSNVMKGYWGMPEETDKVLRPGCHPWEKVLHTGDLFTMDEEGYLYFVARKDDIIKSRGEKVSPKEIENVLCGMPGVAEAAVVGVPDAVLGQAIKAVIVPGNGNILSESEIKRYCARHLEDFMVPSIVEFRSSLPKTASEKIRKADLR
jgi:amino acid adenylation domain-containing protein